MALPEKFVAEFHAECSQEILTGRGISPTLTKHFLRILLAFPEEKISCAFKNPQETVTHEGITWEYKSLAKSAGNMFPADFSLDSAEKSAGKSRISSSE